MDLDKDFETDFHDSFNERSTKDLLGDFGADDDIDQAQKTPTFASDIDHLSELIDIGVNANSGERRVEDSVTKPVGDAPSIEEAAGDRRGSESENAPSVRSNLPFENFYKSDFEFVPSSDKDTKIDNSSISRSPKQEKPTTPEPEPFAEVGHVNTQAVMEAAASGSPSKSNECCPFSPGVWFNPEKLHPVVADFVYWRDIKKTGVLFGTSLLLLLSLKFFSFISVLAYATLAILSVTVSFRIYKNVLQSVKKSNEGHPFKEFLDMDISLSNDKFGNNTEVIIHHLNAVIANFRSLILVEDLFDTLKLMVFAWSLTYLGSWFDGMTILILGFATAFTLPKLYETNQSQIDAYAELIHVKGKELMETINSKIPLGKKKKNE